MTVAGIIAEYNPFRNGHAYLFRELRRAGAEGIAVVISGDFVQRGEAAAISKWARAEQALKCGADLVLELPLPWAVSGAEKFASGGVFLLTALGAQMIGFGSECGEISLLKEAESAISSPLLHNTMKNCLAEGMTFAAARQKAVEELFGKKTAKILSGPNNILGIEYLKAMDRFHSSLVPFTAARAGTSHENTEPSGEFASSSAIRRMLKSGEDISAYLPAPACNILQNELSEGRGPASLLLAERAVLSKLRSMSLSDYRGLPDLSEGLENRLYAASREACSLKELYDAVKTKRYPLARIRRLVLSAFLGINASLGAGNPPYLRVLGIGPNGAGILRQAKSGNSLPILSKNADAASLDDRARRISELESHASDLYALCTPKVLSCGFDHSHKLPTV